MQLQNLSYSTLMDTVGRYTRKFIRFLLVGGDEKEVNDCRRILDSLIRELRRRRLSKHLTREAEVLKQESNLVNLLGLIRTTSTTLN